MGQGRGNDGADQVPGRGMSGIESPVAYTSYLLESRPKQG